MYSANELLRVIYLGIAIYLNLMLEMGVKISALLSTGLIALPASSRVAVHLNLCVCVNDKVLFYTQITNSTTRHS